MLTNRPMLCHLSALLPVHCGVGVSKGTTVTLAAPCNSLYAAKQLIWCKDISPGNDVEYQFCHSPTVLRGIPGQAGGLQLPSAEL